MVTDIFGRSPGSLDPLQAPCELEGVAELCRSHAHRLPKYLGEMTRIRVADFERDFDYAAGGFPDQLLRLQHALSGHEVQRRHSSGLFEDA
jgi:hypothetical protein